MTAEDDHQAELESLENLIDQIQEDAPPWTVMDLEAARNRVHDARRIHVKMLEYDEEDADD